MGSRKAAGVSRNQVPSLQSQGDEPISGYQSCWVIVSWRDTSLDLQGPLWRVWVPGAILEGFLEEAGVAFQAGGEGGVEGERQLGGWADVSSLGKQSGCRLWEVRGGEEAGWLGKTLGWFLGTGDEVWGLTGSWQHEGAGIEGRCPGYPGCPNR